MSRSRISSFRLPALVLLSLSLAACSASLPPAATTPAPAVSSSLLGGVILTLSAPYNLSSQYLNLGKTTRIDMQIDGGPTTTYTLGSAQAPCVGSVCTITLGALSPESHTFTVGSYGVNPATNTTTLISQGSLTQTLTAGQNNALSLTLEPVNVTYRLHSAVRQFDTVSKTFGNYVNFVTQGGRSLPAYYDIQALDSVGDVIPTVLCGSGPSVVISNISGADHPRRFRVEVQAPGTQTLGVQLGTNCAPDGTVLGTQTVTAVNAGVNTLAAGFFHSLALRSNGTVQAWGDNRFGQLGNGTNTGSNLPIVVSGLDSVVSLGGGTFHSLALRSDGTVWAWGDNVSGQLGNGTTTGTNVPVSVSGLGEVVSLSGGFYHSLALLADGTVRAWGDNRFGQLGNGTTTNSTVPVPVSGLNSVVSLGDGGFHSLALRSDGTVQAWGDNEFGQLGNGATTDSTVPVSVSGLDNVVSLGGGTFHSLSLRSDGTVRAWGYNRDGQLGNGTTADSTVPVPVSGLDNVVSLGDGGSYHSLALRSDGTVRAWGDNRSGQLGNGTATSTSLPIRVSGLDSVVSLSGGANHSLALRSNGTVRAWGDNHDGQLGNGTYTNTSTPVAVNVSGVMQPLP